jgi:tryptophan synthase alpha chain
MGRISDTFTELGRRGERALIAYLMAGDPDPALTPRIARAVARHADILELGIPFSDPIADGPTIQAAGNRALRAGMTPSHIFGIIAAIRAETEIPIVVMSYYNPILQVGVDRFLQKLAGVGGDGIIVPDLPVEEAAALLTAAKKHEIDTILLIAPTTPNERIEQIAASSSGFIYLVSLLGVTGARAAVSAAVKPLVERVAQRRRDIPIAVGFGISKPEHVREIVATGAKGVIVGSAIVDLIAKHKDEPEQLLTALDEFCAALKEATKATDTS